jgi:release factor glutamine methyltransferase
VSADAPWTVGRLLDWTAGYLADKGMESPRLEAQVLLAHALGCKRIDLYVRHDQATTDEVRTRFKGLIQERIKGCPVAYLVGVKEFYSLEFFVDGGVLIPRPATETLVGAVLELLRTVVNPRVLDVGTGSGCLPIATAKYHPTARFTAVDISPRALGVAERNAGKHEVAGRIRFLEGDLFAPLSAEDVFDLILSNPPYIRTDDLKDLAPDVRDFEPRLALDGGPDGFAVFDRLLAGAYDHLAPGGHLLVEIGAAQEADARARVQAHGGYELGPTLVDADGHPRVLRARRITAA